MIILTSCANKKNIIYLQDLQEGKKAISYDYTKILQADDILNILISSQDQQGVQPFNLYMRRSPEFSEGGAGGVQNFLANYTIRKDGTIEFPMLGTLEIAGLTVKQVNDLIKSKIEPYIIKPLVIVEWLNFRFTVLGEVNRPGQYRSNNERVSILDAIGLAGDLGIYGNRKKIVLIRENGGERETYFIDLTNSKFIESQAYYIKQNDVIIVSPNNAQVQSSAFNRNIPIYISLSSTIIALLIFINR